MRGYVPINVQNVFVCFLLSFFSSLKIAKSKQNFGGFIFRCFSPLKTTAFDGRNRPKKAFGRTGDLFFWKQCQKKFLNYIFFLKIKEFIIYVCCSFSPQLQQSKLNDIFKIGDKKLKVTLEKNPIIFCCWFRQFPVSRAQQTPLHSLYDAVHFGRTFVVSSRGYTECKR